MRACTPAIVVRSCVAACGVGAPRRRTPPCAACLARQRDPGQVRGAAGRPRRPGRRWSGSLPATKPRRSRASASRAEGGRRRPAADGVPPDALRRELGARSRVCWSISATSDAAADVEALAYRAEAAADRSRGARAARGSCSASPARPPSSRRCWPATWARTWTSSCGRAAGIGRAARVWQRSPAARTPDRSRRHCSRSSVGRRSLALPMPADAGVARRSSPISRALRRCCRAASCRRRRCRSRAAACRRRVPQSADARDRRGRSRLSAGAALTVTPTVPGVERVTLRRGDAIVRVPLPARRIASPKASRSSARATLTVEEIVARHQAAAARQAAAVRDLISTGHVDADVRGARVSRRRWPITSRDDRSTRRPDAHRARAARRSASTASRSGGGGVPRLPIIEPERVAVAAARDHADRRLSLPARRDETDRRPSLLRRRLRAARPRARRCSRAAPGLPRTASAMVQVAAAQTGLRGPIVASEQIDEFREAQQGVWLLARSDVRQIYEGAAHRTPIHRVLVDATPRGQPAGLRRRAGRPPTRRTRVMLRDTPEGYPLPRSRERRRSRTPAAPPEPAGRAGARGRRASARSRSA